MAILGYDKFNLLKLLETRGLAGWLEIATDDLEAPAKQRIVREIEAHYAEAVSAHLAAGETEHSAQSTALAELGDPRVATVNFQKRYLTVSEAKWMHSWERIAGTPLFSSSMVCWDIMPFAALALLYPYPQWIINFRLLAFAALIAYPVFRLIPRVLRSWLVPRTHFFRALALWSCLPLTAVGLAFALFVYTQHDSRGFFDYVRIFNAAFFFYFWGFNRNPGWRVLFKLRKTVAISGEETPPNQMIST
ncbi:MAG TPA: hypothetical protein VGR14_06195 [Verrucomicrobiae bacterium]|jgi:hypothetical protein|nr:hypothetical protein [Verrucomicrobiae bacterium]